MTKIKIMSLCALSLALCAGTALSQTDMASDYSDTQFKMTMGLAMARNRSRSFIKNGQGTKQVQSIGIMNVIIPAGIRIKKILSIRFGAKSARIVKTLVRAVSRWAKISVMSSMSTKISCI